MRPVPSTPAGFNAAAAAAAAAAAPAAASASSAIHSAWHSPVPYLFGGLAAMLGLIAFALLILACSYWKLSGYLEAGAGADALASDPSDEKPPASMLPPPIWEDKIVVIMAGELKPTYLATPMSSRNSSFGDRSNKGEDQAEKDEKKDHKEIAMGSLKEAQHSEEEESQRHRDQLQGQISL